jgi:hypothetical protein
LPHDPAIAIEDRSISCISLVLRVIARLSFVALVLVVRILDAQCKRQLQRLVGARGSLGKLHE